MPTLATDLGAVFDAFTSYQRTAAMEAAIELDVFTAIGAAGATLPEVAERSGASARGLRALCSRLVVDGFLTLGVTAIALAPAAEIFLDRASPAFAGSAISFLTSPHIVAGFDRLTEAVRRGGTALGEQNALAPEHPVWVEFARHGAVRTRDRSAPGEPPRSAQRDRRGRSSTSRPDTGCSGSRCSRRTRRRRSSRSITNVLTVARENAAASGVGARLAAKPGSAFEVDRGDGYDLVLLPNFLHHFDENGCVTVAEGAPGAAPRGRVVIVEFVPNEDRVTPPEAAGFALTMLAGTPGGDAYTFAEYQVMLRAAGFPDQSSTT
jgi:hypothetical protein